MYEFIFLALMAQAAPDETSTPSATPETPRVTNSGETFKDPFAPGAEAPSTPTPALTPTPAPTVAPSPNSESQFEEVAPQGMTPQGQAPTNTIAPIAPPPPKKEFNFPELEEFKGPVTQEVVQQEQSYIDTPMGAWNFGMGVGMGANVNKRHQQIQMEFHGGYRLRPHFELGGLLSYRFVDDKLIGMVVTGNYVTRATRAPSMRIDMTLGGGLGWSLRATGSKFTEGRFTARAQGGAVFYVSPTFALTTDMAFETFVFKVTSDGDGTNLMGDGGPPTQLILTVGTRWEF